MEVNYEIVLEYLQSGRYPVVATKNLKRVIRKKSAKFSLKDGLLFYSSSGTLKQWISTKEKQNQIIEHHAILTTWGTFGTRQDSTEDNIKVLLIILFFS